jgi:uncharacterized protein (TIGR02145 family)
MIKPIIASSFLILSLINVIYPQNETDSIVDMRDGKIYKTIKIGNQWWMAENLNIGVLIDYTQWASDNNNIEKYCYNNSDSMCNIYGGLYLWQEMMQYNYGDKINPSNTQGICPCGWHLPADEEWQELIDFLGGRSVAGGKLKETGTNHWKHTNIETTNETGFTALPAGNLWGYGAFKNLNTGTAFWSTKEYFHFYAWSRQMNDLGSGIGRWEATRNCGFSVRCIKD